MAGPTVTLLPLPTVTFQYPQLNPTSQLLALAQPTDAQVLPKGGPTLAERLKPGRGWLLFFLAVLWGGLIAWYVIAQIIAHRR